MKLFKNICLSLAFSFVIGTTAFGGTVITAPIDSRPVSTDYLKNLVEINGDTLLHSQKKVLDMFSGSGSDDKFADSKTVRKDVREFVARNNSEDTTVIINSSTYFTGGLVGSRHSSQYEDTKEGIDELYSLISTYKKPTYYLNIAMPRNLPETRGGAIWPSDSKELFGMGHFYVQYENAENVEYISNNYNTVSPTEFLLEWGYVSNRAFEKGVDSLSPWEIDFLDYCKKTYRDEKYTQYMDKYKKPFENTAMIFKSIMRWQRAGLIEEIVIGNDDLQLPDFIYYVVNNNQNNNWIDFISGSPIKYSFSRQYIRTDSESIYANIEKNYGKDEAIKAEKGISKNVNLLCGMDEIPQLIYASDTVRRKGVCPQINFYELDNVSGVDSYDVKNPREIATIYKNFVTKKANNKCEELNIFVHDYRVQTQWEETVANIENLLNSKKSVGLIELFDYANPVIENPVFDKLVADDSILDLSCYSAWNTNANSIGLGLAQSVVYSVADSTGKNIVSNTNLLLRHILEDGIYTATGKRQIISEGYVINASDMTKSQKLKDILFEGNIILKIKDRKVYKGENYVDINSVQFKDYNFPWKRNFECYLDFNIKYKEGKA